MKMNDNEIAEKKVAREILTILEQIYFSEEYKKHRIDYGSNGTRDLILQTIKDKYSIA